MFSSAVGSSRLILQHWEGCERRPMWLIHILILVMHEWPTCGRFGLMTKWLKCLRTFIFCLYVIIHELWVWITWGIGGALWIGEFYHRKHPTDPFVGSYWCCGVLWTNWMYGSYEDGVDRSCNDVMSQNIRNCWWSFALYASGVQNCYLIYCDII